MKKTITLLLAVLSLQMTAQCWQSIAKGTYYTVAKKTDGTLWAWGYNNYGQLGDGTNTNKSTPTQIGTQANWQSFAAGASHTAAIKTNGTLWTWGYNNSGQLGDGTWATYRNTPLQIGTATNWQSVAAGDSHIIAIKSDGTLWGWGQNNYCQLGDATYMSHNVPTQIGTANNWAKVTANENYTLAIKTDGTLWAWGRNNYGQLGDGSYTNREEPVQVGSNNNWQTVSAGMQHAVAIKTNGTMWSWGEGFNGRLGDGSYDDHNVPFQIGTATNWQSVAAGDAHSVAIKTNGTLWAWGYNAYGQLGYNTSGGSGVDPSVPNQIGTATDWRNAAAGYLDSTATRNNNSLWAWGINNYGQAGTDTTNGGTTLVGVVCLPSVLATESFETANAISIYPNPVHDVLNLTSDAAITSATLYNVLGQNVLSKNINSNEGQINLSSFPAGTYFVKIDTGNQTKTIKIIKG